MAVNVGKLNPMLQQHLERVAMQQKQAQARDKLKLQHRHAVENAAAKMRQQIQLQQLEHQHEAMENSPQGRMQNQPGTAQNPGHMPMREAPRPGVGMPPGAPAAGPGFG